MADQTERMTEEQLSGHLKRDVEAAVDFVESDIAPDRIKATHYYHGRPFGDEEDGRSSVVMPVTRDTVRSTLPSLMRVFFGGQRIVEFVGTGQVSAEQADEMTSTVEYVFMRQNPGFKVCWSAWKDALVRKVGWVKWYWDDSTRISARVFDRVSEDQLEAAYATLEPDEELEVVSAINET